MRLILATLLLWCSSAMASTSPLLSLFEDGQHLTPTAAISDVEAKHLGEIIEFIADINDDKLLYQFTVADPQSHTLYKLKLDGSDGKVLDKTAHTLTNDAPQLALALKLRQHQQSFSTLTQLALGNTSGYLQQAELDQDLGISYLELKVLDEHGSHKLAFDIEHQRQLPLLKWD
ncbi:PepSY domain-containing protein [Shewanella yunxiaonensis]|uniref:PepSY domain-containing protein n=1 Tax=Shewanella yunxiaonensis TaxID=2829809 RepID=A0ABX7YT92_9GAMM|nr:MULTISPECIES: PepSY domain-containing protein [Shewanella]MDF0534604.1 PepSY domain-containing protein [Shewanella sp. A32]QUN06018.1 PepSY domain-containing protein [Shewanella yunxiaonensis]